MSPSQLLSLAAFLAMAVTAFKRLRPGEPSVRLFSQQSIPFAFLFWIASTAGAWKALAPTDFHSANGFVVLGIVETILAMLAAIYMIISLARRN